MAGKGAPVWERECQGEFPNTVQIEWRKDARNTGMPCFRDRRSERREGVLENSLEKNRKCLFMVSEFLYKFHMYVQDLSSFINLSIQKSCKQPETTQKSMVKSMTSCQIVNPPTVIVMKMQIPIAMSVYFRICK